jgi:uncharacterized protein GlcG (DUF336 family)
MQGDQKLLNRLAISVTVVIGLILASPATAEESPFVEFKVLKTSVALELAQAVLEDCRAKGFQISVAVVDRFGVEQVILRDRFAGPHTPDTARRKAWTAATFRTNTTELAGLIREGTLTNGIRDVTNALVLGGGLRIDAAGTMVGAVGVSGAPGGDADDACAQAGIDAIEDKIAF